MRHFYCMCHQHDRIVIITFADASISFAKALPESGFMNIHHNHAASDMLHLCQRSRCSWTASLLLARFWQCSGGYCLIVVGENYFEEGTQAGLIFVFFGSV
jgi:hypothetical protein